MRFAVDAYVNFCRTRPWLEGAGAALTELFSPDLMTDRLAVFRRHYAWINLAGYAYSEAPARSWRPAWMSAKRISRRCQRTCPA